MRRWPAAIVLTLTASAAHAFLPAPDDGALIVATGAQPRRTRAIEPHRLGGWNAMRDRDTGVVARLWGRFVDVPGAVADGVLAEHAARGFLAQYLDVLAPGAEIDDFALASNRLDDGKRTVAFAQTWNGMRVVGGQIHVVFANDRLFFAGSEALPNVRAAPPRSRLASTAHALAWLRAETNTAPTLRPTGERVVLPIVRGPGDVEYRIVDIVEATTAHGRWDVYVAADGAPIARANRATRAASTLQYDVGERHAGGSRASRPVPLAQITVDGAGVTTAADGGFSWPTSVAATVVPGVVGSVVRVFDDTGPLATASLTVQPGLPVMWSMATDELADAQLSAYVYVNIAKVVARRIHPTLAWLDQQLAVHVNIGDSCNAFSTGDSIHFFKASAECQNTARLADVVHHEFGHSFHEQSIIIGVGGFDFSIVEGFADFFAAHITNDSAVGRGFYFTNDAIRELDPIGVERAYPRDLTLASHTTGLIIGGALWDLRKQLVAKLGTVEGIARADKVFLGLLQRAPDLTMTYMAALVADDDDGDLGNGTPNRCVIESAFGRHGLAGADFRETTLSTPVVDGQRVTVTVETPQGAACEPAKVTSMVLKWIDAAGPGEATMSASGATWFADLPPQPDHSTIRYQITASLDTAETIVFPQNAADPYYQRFIGTPTEIWCERFETDPGWKQTGAIEWEVGVSSPANAAAGDPSAAFAGTTWLGTDLRGDGRYRADILTSIETPAIDASAYNAVHLQYRRWLQIEDAALDVATVRINGMQIWANAKDGAFTLDHLDQEWRFVDFDITSFAHEPVSVAWTLASDPSRNLGGWNLDEICIVGFDKKAICGDGIVDPGEECDDANIDDCTPTCSTPESGGGCCSASGNGLGSMLLAVALAAFVGRPARRRRRPWWCWT